ncbi:MAG TPA: NUDIX hydrolase [Verrucomicrobiae bacterium]|jgi:ADP-ribose pyrophosphatase|nr:NUDIX hydrolase [Verrucomicrobiae bacterium]
MNPERKVLYEGQYIRFVAKGTWEYAERINCSGIVFIAAVTDDDKIILCEQFRVPVDRHVIEIPAGLVNDGVAKHEETLEEAAKRELLEETGYEAQKMVRMIEGPAAAGSSSAMIVFFRALGLKKVASGGGDETENIVVHEVPLKGIDTWLQTMEEKGKAIDPKVFTVLYLVRSTLYGGVK